MVLVTWEQFRWAMLTEDEKNLVTLGLYGNWRNLGEEPVPEDWTLIEEEAPVE